MNTTETLLHAILEKEIHADKFNFAPLTPCAVPPMSIAIKKKKQPVATVSIPLRSIPVVFPEDRCAEKTPPPPPSAKGRDDTAGEGEAEAGSANKRGSRKAIMLCGGPGGSHDKRRVSLSCSRGEGHLHQQHQHQQQHGGNGDSGSDRAPHSGDGLSPEGGGGGAPQQQHQPAPTARQYRLHTLAGPLTNRTMDNGFVVMSLTLVASGNDLLGEPDELDGEDVKVWHECDAMRYGAMQQ